MTASSAEPTSPEESRYQVMRRLTRAAAHSDGQLIAEAAALAGGWAVLVDLMGDVICSTPRTAGPEGVRAAAHPRPLPHLTIRRTTDAVLVINPSPAVAAARVDLIAQTCADLLRLQARAHRAEETLRAEQGLRRAALHLLLNGHAALALNILGIVGVTHATVCRFTGTAIQDAHQALWRTAKASTPRNTPCALICIEGSDLVIALLHGGSPDTHRVLPRLSAIAERHHLAGGVSDPAPLDMIATAWSEAGTARLNVDAGQISSATGMGPKGILQLVPSHRLSAWSAAVLQPLGRDQRRTLEAYLRSGSVQAAASALDVSEGTVRARLRGISSALAVELDNATVQAQLLLAVRTSTAPGKARSTARLVTHPPLPTELLSPDDAHQWAADVLEPLDAPLRIALRCWLQHRGRTAPAASELRLSRSTLTEWCSKIGDVLHLDLQSATVRAELHLASETIATPEDAARFLPRRGGRTYRNQRSY
ncbi:helix-turn-helix domain-containing protein [Streptomyces xanthochromogenes]|uniref:helix-turn-helix domain-containing protein n=1 Tax=Streptomyces xanthochromogenes TaxID=67384 RepID=UPI0037F3FBBD